MRDGPLELERVLSLGLAELGADSIERELLERLELEALPLVARAPAPAPLEELELEELRRGRAIERRYLSAPESAAVRKRKSRERARVREEAEAIRARARRLEELERIRLAAEL